MPYLAYIILFFSAINLLLGIVIFTTAKKDRGNVGFFFFALICSLWTFNNFYLRLNPNINLLRLAYGAGIIVATVGLVWIYLFLKKDIPFFVKWFIVPLSLPIFYLTTFSGYVIEYLVSVQSFGYESKAGGFFALYSAYFGFNIILILYNLISELVRKKEKSERQQIVYVLIGAALFSIVAFLVSFIIPTLFNNFSFTAFDNLALSLFLIFIVYAILKHHLFDIKVIATELLTFAIWIILLVKTFSSETTQDWLLNGALLAAMVVFGLLLIRSVLREVRQREQIEKLAEEVKRAYEVEKRANEELKKLDEIKNQFLMQTQHDLRTPLSTIRGYCDLLLNGTFGKQPKQTVEVLERIEVVAEDKIKDVNNFLDVTQFQLGKKVVNLSPGINLNEILAEIQDRLEPNAAAKGIYLKLEKPESAIIVEADREKLKSALFNIVDNSIKYTVNGGITIAVNSKSEARNPKQIQNSNDQNSKPVVLITVRDTGVGMSKEQCQKLFDTPFQRGEQAKKMSATGKGVGLYLSGKIIAEHKGKIWAESEGEEKGSTFYIELPVS